MSTPLRLDAPAKLNLSLRVTGRREDGYHLLEGEWVLLELADRLLLLPGCSGLRVEGERIEGVPVGAENLAWRGLVLGMEGTPDLAFLALEKRIPVGAGLGGGSSDAAAAWRLGRAWRDMPDVPSREDLETLSGIGADVPFLASGLPAATVRGIGERLEPIAAEARDIVLVHPPFALSTAAVFGELRREEWGRAENDLLAPAIRVRPELGDIVSRVARAGGEPRLTGSGSTIFSIADDVEHARSLAARIGRDGLSVSITRTRTTGTCIRPIEEDDHDHP